MNKTMALGPFKLERPIASGGAGVVWLGNHKPTSQKVAVKVVSSKSKSSESIDWTFRTEAQAASALYHPSVVPIYEYGQVSKSEASHSAGYLNAGSPYLVTAFVGGGTLKPHLGKLDWEQIAWILDALLDALAHAHARGVIHRDIKPANVLVTKDRRNVQLTDFGIAYAVDQYEIEKGGDKMVAGTPSFMAPEQVFGSWRDHGPWTDLYALGCLAWAMVLGEPPGGQRTLEEAVEAWKRQEHKPFKCLFLW